MSTPKLSTATKSRRAFSRFAATLPANWRVLLTPWRLIPNVVTLAAIALIAFTVALAAFADTPATVGGTSVPSDLDCAEDTVIAFTGIDTLGCVHIDQLEDYAN